MLLALLVLAGAAGVGAAVATVTSTTLVDTTSVRLRVDRTSFVPSSDQPRFSSGWHVHPGPVIIQVQEGYLKIEQGSTCRPHVVGPGGTYIETPQLPVIARANKAAKWTATLVVPSGVPRRVDVADPCD
jgi:hypothetical protein